MPVFDQKAVLGAPVRRISAQSLQSFYMAFAITGVIEFISLASNVSMWNLFDRVISARSS
jgi:ABC-type protease/lipase transport system fused ATPase/permease subunit